MSAVAASTAGCSDDDAEPAMDAGPGMDAGPDGSAGTGNAGSGGSRAPVAGRDAGTGRDAADACSAYPLEPMPLWDHGEEPVIDARRAPLAELCPRGCVRSLADFMADLTCVPVPGDGGIDDVEDDFDGGIYTGLFRYWLRSEGCGSVQFSTVRPSWPRNYDFDADTGALIGFAQLDDVGGPLPGAGDDACMSAAWIAGEIRQSCADEQLSVCERRR